MEIALQYHRGHCSGTSLSSSRFKVENYPQGSQSQQYFAGQRVNPKISDFGLARAFGGDQTEENTRMVAGT